MRIAFLASEFMTEVSDGGGLANYLNRMGRLLLERGHEVEIFTKSASEPRVLNYAGMRVERVPAPANRGLLGIANRFGTLLRLGYACQLYLQARSMASALERRHVEAPFDLVQSADYLAVGLCVRRARRRIHVVRCSSAADLYNEIDERDSLNDRWRVKLEFASIRRADLAYAPSRFIAEHLQDRLESPVKVVRPPFSLETMTALERLSGFPDRYLIHFGHLSKRKGTHWLAQALPRAFAMEPDLRMVWIGRADWDRLSPLLAGLGPHREKLQVLYPLPKRELYSVLRNADAAVLPSLVDNLPNTVIESLLMGIPVVGTRGASIDELVEQDRTGVLVSPNDVDGLAAALVRMWRRQTPVVKGFQWKGPAVEDMSADAAVEALLSLARPQSKPWAEPRQV